MKGRIPISKRVLAVSALLAVVTLTTYWPLLESDFIRFDDSDYVTANKHVKQGLTWENALWAFRTPHANNWHPLTWLSHMLDVQLFGLRPGWHHFTNLALHTANVLLVLGLFYGLTGAFRRSALVAGLFAVHPLHVESVAWVAERKDVLSTFFFLLTLLAYAKYTQERGGDGSSPVPSEKTRDAPSPPRRARWNAAALALFTLGLLSKPMVVTLPFVLLLLDYWPLRRFGSNANPVSLKTLLLLVKEKVPFFCLAAAASAVTYLVQQQSHAVVAHLPLALRAVNACVSYVQYLANTLWPTHLAVYYPHPSLSFASVQHWPAWEVAGAILLLAAVSTIAWLGRKHWPWLLMGWCWYLGTLVPVIGLVQVGNQARADRYTYIPLIGIFVGAVWSGAQLARARLKDQQLLPAGAIMLVLICAAAARRQAETWRNTQTLFEHALAVTSSNAVAHVGLGEELLGQGKTELALGQFDLALRINPYLADAHFDRGKALEAQGKADQATEAYQQALSFQPWLEAARKRLAAQLWSAGRKEEALAQCRQAVDQAPGDPEARINLGGMLWQLGRKEEAIAEYEAAARLDPAHPVAHYNLGLGRAAQGRLRDAEQEYLQAVRLKPDYVEALGALGRTLTLEGKLTEALQPLRQLARLQPTNTDFQVNLGNALLLVGRTNEAAASFASALRLEPNLPQRLVEAGASLLSRGQRETAAARFATALRLQPEHPEAQGWMGMVLAEQGQLDPAANHYRQALQAKPDWPEALAGLAWILATHPRADVRNGTEAVRLAERACGLDGGKTPRFYAALDAAYAEAGRFPEAIAAAEQTRRLASAAGDTKAVAAAEQRLGLYGQRQAYHQRAQ